MAKIKLQDIDTRSPKKAHKDHYKKELEKLKVKLEALQNLMYAEGKHALLIILQGMDAAGKDGVVRNVFEIVNPTGCRVISFKKPTELEMKHDFLWRVHNNVPEKGFIHIFNRSHYEDVLIQRVHQWVSEKTIKERYVHINNFEKLLEETGTHILKFYLHISKEEQLSRLQERMSDRTKMWKYNEDDLKERELWNHYMKAYQDAINHCSVAAPWHVVPSDQNWYKEHYIATKVVETLESLNMKFPGFKKKETNF
ncbi:MAG TPA: PPK2 family polyphosphate kinase [Chitinophagales bacterium]|nr:PPK2 family polyphosphate kinase [Chitinophagales bacterium]